MERPGLLEVLGLVPLGPALRAAREAMLGGDGRPPVRWGPSSLRILKPRIALPAWLGWRRRDGRAWVYNLFNRDREAAGGGYSVRVTCVRDFRGGDLGYDSHHGTDFAVPPGTTVVAAAPGRVLGVTSFFDYGGLKVLVDHGGGLCTVSNHLARALVREGDAVGRGDPIGLSGASGMEFVLCFPWVAPHLHFDVMLGGAFVDPFAAEGEVSLWRAGNDPVPHAGPPDRAFEPTRWDPDGVAAGVAACRDAPLRARLAGIPDLALRAGALLAERVFHPHRFDGFPAILAGPSPRRPCLDLPFPAAEVTGVAFPGGRSPVPGAR